MAWGGAGTAGLTQGPGGGWGWGVGGWELPLLRPVPSHHLLGMSPVLSWRRLSPKSLLPPEAIWPQCLLSWGEARHLEGAEVSCGASPDRPCSLGHVSSREQQQGTRAKAALPPLETLSLLNVVNRRPGARACGAQGGLPPAAGKPGPQRPLASTGAQEAPLPHRGRTFQKELRMLQGPWWQPWGPCSRSWRQQATWSRK